MQVTFTSSPTIEGVPWADLGCEMVLECTGNFLTTAVLQPYLDNGVKRVVVSAPGMHIHVCVCIHVSICMVLECTENFLTTAVLQPYLDNGVKRVVVSAPGMHMYVCV